MTDVTPSPVSMPPIAVQGTRDALTKAELNRAAEPGVLLRQQAIRATCVHPTGTFIAFAPEAIEQSIPNRFEQQVARHPDENLGLILSPDTLAYLLYTSGHSLWETLTALHLKTCDTTKRILHELQ